MPDEPIVFISHFGLKPGHADAFRTMWRSVIRQLEAAKPATSAQVAYLDEAGSRLSIVHVFPSPDALAAHFLGSDQRSLAVYAHIVPAGWEIYGRPHDEQLAGLRAEAASAGVTLTVEPEAIGGFMRLAGR
jgi:hypothetical protein